MARPLVTFTRILLPCTLAACSSYTPAPVEPADLLHDLRERRVATIPTDGLTPEIATATALTHNPDLRTTRLEAGIADAMLLEAGLWSDLQFGWDAMDWLIGGSRDDALSGVSATVPLFRPDERDALRADAAAGVQLVRARLLEAEWRLTRMVRERYLRLAEAREGLQLARQALEVATRTVDLLRRGLDAGGATRFDLEMAVVQEAVNRRQLQKQQREADLARFHLNALMGLAPDSDYLTLSLAELEQSWPSPPFDDAEILVDHALQRRPDLRALQAAYDRTEAALRLEVSRQWPGLAVGTGFALELPLFSSFNKPSIRTAELRRELAAAALEAAIADLRSEAWSLLRDAQGQATEWQGMRDVVAPALERSLSMSRQAQEMGALSFLEVLFAQRQLLATRREALTAHAAALRAQADLAWLLGPADLPAELPATTER
jgi:cobalt-zinc-cadmium efflux system outer membrane protein